jgi:RHS repeat-associated protein
MSTSTTYYYYDSLNRLSMESSVRVVNGYIRSYSYDSVGNRLTMINGTTTVNYNYNNLNQLTSSTSGGVGTSHSYDANGNLTDNYNQWNYENELTYNGLGGDGGNDYNYDALGHRVYWDNTNGVSQIYFYDGINVLMERYCDQPADNYETNAVYTLAPGDIKEIISVHLNAVYTLGPSMDLFYHYDPVGNVLFVSDTSGNINTSYVQEGFGNVIAQSGSADNNYHLTTKEQDSNTGLYYFNARWYDPSVGRFVSKDPIRYINRYSYVNNNPTRFIDPLGLAISISPTPGVPGSYTVYPNAPSPNGGYCTLPPQPPNPSKCPDQSPSSPNDPGQPYNGVPEGWGNILPEPINNLIPFTDPSIPYNVYTICSVLNDRNSQYPDIWPGRNR